MATVKFKLELKCSEGQALDFSRIMMNSCHFDEEVQEIIFQGLVKYFNVPDDKVVNKLHNIALDVERALEEQ